AEDKWRAEAITREEMQLQVIRSKVEPGAELPSDENIFSRLVDLESGSQIERYTRSAQEAVIYIVEGQADVKVGKLGGRLAENDFVHVPVGTAYSARAAVGPALVLLFEMPSRV
ncbi:MAG: hypothetical protein ACWGO1_04320, partial [Anaerolineales bacterium]